MIASDYTLKVEFVKILLSWSDATNPSNCCIFIHQTRHTKWALNVNINVILYQNQYQLIITDEQK